MRKLKTYAHLFGLSGSVAVLYCMGCGLLDGYLCAHPVLRLNVNGTLVDEATDTAIGDVQLGGRTFTNGEEIGNRFGGPDGGITLDGNGSFSIPFSDFGTICPNGGPQNVDSLARTDRIEIVVVREGCEQSFFIDVNENTVVDVTFPDGVLELTDPIRVPPCDAEGGTSP